MHTDWENHRRALAAALNLGACLQVRGVERGANAACRPLTRQGITEAWSALQEAMPAILAEEDSTKHEARSTEPFGQREARSTEHEADNGAGPDPLRAERSEPRSVLRARECPSAASRAPCSVRERSDP